jgi:hypothetical protein
VSADAQGRESQSKVALTKRHIHAVKLTLPNMPDRASLIGGVCDKFEAVGVRKKAISTELAQDLG